MLISVVTCSFNSKKTIERTIKSILYQTMDDYEYLIIDGMSSDATVEIIKRYEPLFKGKLRWISEKDNGIYDAMNKGIRMAKGEYIWLVNSDDYLESNALEIVADRIKTMGSKIVSGYIEFFSEDCGNRRIFKYSPEESEREYRKKRMGINHPATIVSKCIYEDYGTYDSKFFISADVDWFLRLKENKVPIDIIDVKLSNMSDGGISGQNDNIKKRIHDWKLLFGKHTRNKMEYWKFMLLRIVTFYKTFVFNKR